MTETSTQIAKRIIGPYEEYLRKEEENRPPGANRRSVKRTVEGLAHTIESSMNGGSPLNEKLRQLINCGLA